jgi:gliding motility-associated lipoprotein GldD
MLMQKQIPDFKTKVTQTTVVMLSCFMLLVSCGAEPEPKPYGYFRIGLPQEKHQTLELNCPYQFDINTAARWEPHREMPCWGDVYYPDLKARIQFTYKPIDAPHTRDQLFKEAQDLAFRHTVVADGIRERSFENPTAKVYGTVYQMVGNAASNTQFFLTDSTGHFLRGALYFYSQPNADSLRPVNEFMFDEIVQLVESLEWKNSLQ